MGGWKVAWERRLAQVRRRDKGGECSSGERAHSTRGDPEDGMNRRLEGANSVCDDSVVEEDGCKALWRAFQKKEEMLQSRSRWRKRNLQRRSCSAVRAETMEKESEREQGKRGEAKLTHISITMQCQWSVCEVSCCLVTVLQQQYQCAFMCVILTVVGVGTTLPLLPPCLLPLLTRNALTHACSRRSLDGAATQSAPDAQYCREASWCRGVDDAPRMNRVHRPRCPAVTPPINHDC